LVITGAEAAEEEDLLQETEQVQQEAVTAVLVGAGTADALETVRLAQLELAG
jgi:hypothetical protein